MAKYRDTRTLGRSRIAPYRPGEHPLERHERRLAVNLRFRSECERRLRRLGFQLEVKNSGQHWQFRRQGELFAQWWPSSAKLVRGVEFERGVHVHDFEQVIEQLKRWCWS